jgi:hypothetical protein
MYKFQMILFFAFSFSYLSRNFKQRRFGVMKSNNTTYYNTNNYNQPNKQTNKQLNKQTNKRTNNNLPSGPRPRCVGHSGLGGGFEKISVRVRSLPTRLRANFEMMPCNSNNNT